MTTGRFEEIFSEETDMSNKKLIDSSEKSNSNQSETELPSASMNITRHDTSYCFEVKGSSLEECIKAIDVLTMISQEFDKPNKVHKEQNNFVG
jgi:hypothetical protein